MNPEPNPGKPSLCRECAKRFKERFPEGNCHICGNLLLSLDSLIKKAGAELQKHPEWNSFSLSTSIPKKLLANEEEAWDYSGGESIKSWLNGVLSHALADSSGKTYSPIGADGRITINFTSSTATSANEPLFIFGRYKKLATGICQSKWVCLKCNGSGCKHCNGKGKMYDESVEEIIGDAAISQTGGEYTLHASGREDIDVLNFAGRPFVLEIKNPQTLPLSLEKLSAQVNSTGKVEVSGLKLAPPTSVTIVSDSHFPKTYRAWISSDSQLTKEDASKLLSFDFTLAQHTPERVAHRRADKTRMRHAKILSATLELQGAHSPNPVIVADIRADAGTYIKELIHGDNGRTVPSISSFLGKPCACARLDVIQIEDDFLTLVLG